MSKIKNLIERTIVHVAFDISWLIFSKKLNLQSQSINHCNCCCVYDYRIAVYIPPAPQLRGEDLNEYKTF